MLAMTVIAEPRLRVAVTPVRNVIVRDASGTGDGSWTIEGYAAVFEQETVLYDGKWFVVREVISRHAFDNVLGRVGDGDELVHLNHGHQMESSVAASNVDGIGSLELSADSHGLRFFARVDVDDPDAIRMAVKMRRGVVAQASFAFTIADEEVTIRDAEDGKEDELWRINEIGSLYDVCVCAQGAYPQTESAIRSLAAASMRVPDLGTLGQPPQRVEGKGHQGQPPPGDKGPIQVAPETVGQVETGRSALLKAQAVDHRRIMRKEGALT